jgi:hypothetical protein
MSASSLLANSLPFFRINANLRAPSSMTILCWLRFFSRRLILFNTFFFNLIHLFHNRHKSILRPFLTQLLYLHEIQNDDCPSMILRDMERDTHVLFSSSSTFLHQPFFNNFVSHMGAADSLMMGVLSHVGYRPQNVTG